MSIEPSLATWPRLALRLAVVSLSLRIGELRRTNMLPLFLFVLIAVVVVLARRQHCRRLYGGTG